MAMFYSNSNDIDSVNLINYIRVDKSMVEKCIEEIMKRLEKEKNISLYEYYNMINNYKLIYNNKNQEQSLKIFGEKISAFMAMQEALMNLVSKGRILPVNSRNNIEGSVCYNYECNQSNMRTSGTRHFELPIIPYQCFILVPSELYK